MMMTLNANGHEPIYQQLLQNMRSLLPSSEFPIGAKFLSERQMAERFEVSRPTANKVLASLMAEGLLSYKKGVGTFVQEPVLSYELRDLVSFTEKAKAAGKTPSTQVIDFHPCTADELEDGIQKALQVKGKDPIFYLERLRLADNEPMIHEARYIAARHCMHLSENEVGESLYAVWTEQYQLSIAGADQRIRAIIAEDALADHLDIENGSACFQVQCTGFTGMEPLWWERTTYRGDAYELISRIGNQDDGQPVRGVLR